MTPEQDSWVRMAGETAALTDNRGRTSEAGHLGEDIRDRTYKAGHLWGDFTNTHAAPYHLVGFTSTPLFWSRNLLYQRGSCLGQMTTSKGKLEFIGLILLIKGALAWDFLPLVFIINRPHFGSVCEVIFLFKFYFKFAELYKFKNRSALWPPWRTEFFLQNPET